MLRLIGTFKDMAILSLRTGGAVAGLGEPVINPNNLKIEGWYCQDVFEHRKLILLSTDIRETIPQGFIVDDLDVLADPEDLVRLHNVLELEFELLGKKVATVRGKTLGKVNDYALDMDSMIIQKLYVGQSLLRSLNGGLTIDRRQIVEITEKKVIVKDTDVTVANPLPVLKTAPVRPAYSPSSNAAAIEEYP